MRCAGAAAAVALAWRSPGRNAATVSCSPCPSGWPALVCCAGAKVGVAPSIPQKLDEASAWARTAACPSSIRLSSSGENSRKPAMTGIAC
eukprot:scaffold228005_cov22-Tisochrysis_lutea.AAC.3